MGTEKSKRAVFYRLITKSKSRGRSQCLKWTKKGGGAMVWPTYSEGARIFGDLFLRRRPTYKILVRKIDDLFFFLLTFHIFFLFNPTPPKKPAKRHPPPPQHEPSIPLIPLSTPLAWAPSHPILGPVPRVPPVYAPGGGSGGSLQRWGGSLHRWGAHFTGGGAHIRGGGAEPPRAPPHFRHWKKCS
jgi:hypothetical protein